MHCSDDLRTQARTYLDQFGWSLIPVGSDKKPTCPSWKGYQTTPPSPGQLDQWFQNSNATGIAVVLGAVSGGLRCRDFDVAEAYERWAASHPAEAASLPTSRTGRGFHVFFRAELPDRVQKLGDGELRAGGGYCVLPPSLHSSGTRYQWLIPAAAEIPFLKDPVSAGLLAPTLTEHKSAHPPVARYGPLFPDLDPAVRDAILATAPTGPGQRHNRLFEYVRRLMGINGLDLKGPDGPRCAEAWFAYVEPVIRTKEFEETLVDFEYAVEHARTAWDDGLLQGVVAAAMEAPVPDWVVQAFPRAEKSQRLVLLCQGLQAMAGANPFFLSARKAGALLGVTDGAYAHKLLQRLERAEFLVPVERGKLAGRLATTWRFAVPPGVSERMGSG